MNSATREIVGFLKRSGFQEANTKTENNIHNIKTVNKERKR
jgi:hypothetical protein